MGQKVITGFGVNLTYRLHPGTISPLFADLLYTSHAQDCVPRLFAFSETVVFILSAIADLGKC